MSEYFSRENLLKRVQDKVSPMKVEIEHQKYMPNGGYRILIDGMALGDRTTLKGINTQADAFLIGWNLSKKEN